MHAPRPAPEVAVRLASPEELMAAGEVVRLAYAADGLAGEGYLRVVADAALRAREADVAVAVPLDGGTEAPLDGGTAAPLGAGPAVLGSVTFALHGSRWAQVARPGEAEFRMLGVHPAARGRDVGAALVAWCVARARDAGCRAVALSSADTMAAAHRLYERFGFARRPDLDWVPEADVRLLGYVLDLRERPALPQDRDQPAASAGRRPNSRR